MSHRLPLILTLFLLYLLPALAGAAGGTKIDPKETGGAPAVYAQKVEALRGQPLEIELKGTHRSGSLQFILRNPPKLGRIEGPPVSKTKTSAVVRYIPTPGLKGDKDEFSFAAQVPGSSTSEPATVTIVLSDAAPMLDTLPLVDAGRVVMGHPSPRVFNIKNAGNAPWAAKVPAPKGWHWVNPEGGNFKIAPGEDLRCEISCDALEVANMDETIPLLGTAKIQFVARIVPPFTVLPRQLTLTWNAAAKSRTGSIEIQNLDNRPLKVTAEGPAWAKVPAGIEVAPDAKAVLTLNVAGEYEKSLAGTVKIAAGNYSHLVEVKAGPAPAILSLTAGARSDGGLHFGKLNAETIKAAKAVLTLKNTGGTASPLVFSPLRDFRIEAPPAEGFTLAPGMETTITVLPPVNVAGTFREDLTVSAGETSLNILITAGVDSSVIPLSPTEEDLLKLIRPAAGGSRPVRMESEIKKISLANAKGVYLADGTEDVKLPRINLVDLEKDTGTAVTFGWDLPPGDGWKFRLYRAGVEWIKSTRNESGKEMVKIWIPCGDEVKYTVEGRRATATVSGLNPGVWFKCCLQTIAPDGRKSMLGKELGFVPIPPPLSHWQKYWAYYAGGAVCMVALGYWLRKKWNAPINAVT